MRIFGNPTMKLRSYCVECHIKGMVAQCVNLLPLQRETGKNASPCSEPIRISSLSL